MKGKFRLDREELMLRCSGMECSRYGVDCAFHVREFYKNNGSAIIARRNFSNHHDLSNVNQAPYVSLIRKWVDQGHQEITKT